MHGRFAATGVGTVHDVVVQQREVVEHFDGESGRFGAVDLVAEQVAGHQQRDRTDSFAALFERIDDRSVQQFGLLRIFQVFDFVLNDIGQFVERVHNAGF